MNMPLGLRRIYTRLATHLLRSVTIRFAHNVTIRFAHNGSTPNSHFVRVASRINAKRTGEELYHFLPKIDCAQSSCKWEDIRILGLVRIYTLQGLGRTRTRAHIYAGGWAYRREVIDICLESVRHVTDILVY